MVLYAKDIVEAEFLTMPPRCSVLEAAKAMATRRHGFAIVMSPEGTPVGIVTEWDILAKVVAPGRDPSGPRHEGREAPGRDSCADDPRAHAGLHRLGQRSDRAGSAHDFLIARSSTYEAGP